MRRLTLRSLWEHKRRFVSTLLAVLLGVAFMSGTFVLADTLDHVFDDLFSEGNAGVDVQVQGEELFDSNFGGARRGRFDQSVLETVRGVDGVAAAAPFVITFGFGSQNRVLDADGDTVGARQGPPTLIESWVEDEIINPYEISAGRPPQADDELALNVAAAEDGEFAVGDMVTVATQFGNRQYRLVGTFRFGDAESSAGAVSADFTLAEAQRLAGAPGKVDTVSARAVDGVSDEELVRRIRAALPEGVEAITGEQAAADLADSVTSGFQFLRVILTVFAVIALLVGGFVIFNTFSILVAQRTRELALLRAVGASRAQVLGSVVLEAAVVGLVAGVLGLAVGVALAAGVTALLRALSVDLPSAGLVVAPGTVITALLVGLLVTTVAALSPAVRATRVPPVAALRDVAIDRVVASRARAAAGVVILVLGGILLAQAWRADGDTGVIPTVGIGAVLVFIGAIAIGPVVAGPSIRVIGVALPRLRGIVGRLATENAARAPKRTAATTSALVIGVALVSFITIFASSAERSVAAEIERGFRADLVVQSDSGGFGPPSGFTPDVARRISARDDVVTVSAIAFGEAQVTYPGRDTARSWLTSIDPATLGDVLTPRMDRGDIAVLKKGGVVVDRQIADDNDLQIGDRVEFVTSGGRVELAIQAVSDDLTILGWWTITNEDYASLVSEQLDLQVFVDLGDGVDVTAAAEAIDDQIADVPSMEVLDRDGFVGDLADQITGILNFIYALLGLSIIIAMIGIANTLSLSVHERTREIGLLRAVGMHRRQLRSTVRWEAVLIAGLGAAVGVALGLVLSRALVQALEGYGLRVFSVPYRSVTVLVLITAGLAVLASIRPARKAARLDVLQAIATE